MTRLIGSWLKKLTQPKTPTPAPTPSSDSDHASSSRQNTSVSSPGHAEAQKSGAAIRSPKKRPQPKSTWTVADFSVPEHPDKVRFHDFDLPAPLMHAIQDLGFQYCTPIQAKALPHALQGLDIIGKAQTGTGKTAAFLIAMIDEMIHNPLEEDRKLGDPRAVILAPTRELVMQIADDAAGLCRHTGIHIATLIGGEHYDKQRRSMYSRPVDIVAATPGRLIDFLTRQDIYLDQVEFLVIDEADRMLDMGFIPQIKRIVRATPKKEERQTLLFSATFPQDVINLSQQWTYKPIHIEVESEGVAADKIDQRVYLVSNSEKQQLLLNLLRDPETRLALVFVNRRDHTQRLYDQIRRAGIPVGILTGDVAQNKRIKTLEDFKQGKYKVLVATDVMGRGIHVDGISHVINYNLPDNPEDYVHRIGRTGRADAEGISISFACENEAFQLPAIEELLGTKLPCLQPPEHLLPNNR
jgi:ATP-dependent RNA helicase RhlB